MKSWKARAGAVPPCSPPTVRASSRPIHTPVVSPLEKPMNQPSLFELVVPVLPATGRPILALIVLIDREKASRRVTGPRLVRVELRGLQPSIVTGSSTIVSVGFIPDSSADR